MRPSLLAALAFLLVPACADEATTSFGSGARPEDSSGGSSSGGLSTTGDSPPTTGFPMTTDVLDPGTGEPGDTSTSTSTSGGADTSTSTGTSTGTSSGDDSTSSSSSSGDTSSTGDESSSSTGEPAPHCDDGVANQDETDVDCGGAICGGCAVGGQCEGDADCAWGWCDAGACAEPGCLVDADCDIFETDCVAATCDVVTKTCDQVAINEGMDCEDGDLCTFAETCDKGGCLAGKLLDCSALDSVCGLGECDPGTGACAGQAFPGTEDMQCDDGFVCTPDDTCHAGLCGAGGPGYLFFEDFAAPAPGWELGELWQIGPAVASANATNGADPGDDHSASDDGALAGTLIGGVIPAGAQVTTCLTSPAIDASAVDSLMLSFWRHLHTDYFPFVTHTIAAFDGAEWQELEKGYANPGVDDPAWTFVEYDLGPLAHEALRVRFCVTQTEGALAGAGWSLDDVTVGPYACTPED